MKVARKQLECDHQFGVALSSVEDDKLARLRLAARGHEGTGNDGIVEVTVLGTLVQLGTARHGTRRSTELVHLLGLVDTAEGRTNDYNALLAEDGFALHEICNDISQLIQRY